MDRITEEDLGVPFIRTLEDHRWDSNYNDIMNFNPTSRGAQRLVWASLREALIVMAAKDARIRELEEGFMRDRVKLLEANNEAWQKVVGELRSRLALADAVVDNAKELTREHFGKFHEGGKCGCNMCASIRTYDAALKEG